MKSTSACSVLMIAPQGFGYNVQTASSNVYQKRVSVSEKELVRKAVREWENLVHLLQKEGIEVITFDNIHGSLCPDAVFPNNWISLHPDGTIVLYPMMSENRRKERRDDIVEKISSLFDVKKTLDLTFLENKNVFLEGTGSVCFYHPGKLAFAAVSPRTNRDAFLLLCEKLQYEGVLFHTKGPDKCPVYHTNVVMNVCGTLLVWCPEAIPDPEERKKILEKSEQQGLMLLPINLQQMNAFCANVLSLQGKQKEIFVVSSRAWNHFLPSQKKLLESRMHILTPDMDIIEDVGGGGVRCMLAEIFLNKKTG